MRLNRQINPWRMGYFQRNFPTNKIFLPQFLKLKVRIGHEPVRLEVLTSITGVAFADAYVRRIEVEVNGLAVPFISLVDLIKNKLATGRGKDRVDAETLQKRATP